MATHILLNLNINNQSFPAIKSPNEFFKTIVEQLNEWIAFIPNLFHSLVAKFDEAFPPEILAKWAAVAAAVVVLCLFCWCCMPAIISCITWLVVACWNLISGVFMCLWRMITWPVVACWNLIRGVFMWLWRMCCKVFSVCCCCGRRSLKTMTAPGTGGRVRMPRAPFESNPASYFRGLRAGTSAYVS